jgi:hypothetical protein
VEIQFPFSIFQFRFSIFRLWLQWRRARESEEMISNFQSQIRPLFFGGAAHLRARKSNFHFRFSIFHFPISIFDFPPLASMGPRSGEHEPAGQKPRGILSAQARNFTQPCHSERSEESRSGPLTPDTRHLEPVLGPLKPDPCHLKAV